MVPEVDLHKIGVFDQPRERCVVGTNCQFDAEPPGGNKHMRRHRRLQNRDDVPVRRVVNALGCGEGEQGALRAAPDEAGHDVQHVQPRTRGHARGHGSLRRRRSRNRRATCSSSRR